MSRQFYNQVLQPLLELLQVASSVVFTRTAEEYVQWLQEQGDALFDRVLVAVGGDAVLHETANHVMRSAARARPLHLFVVPCGSGNALASSCGIRAPSDALQRLASPRGYRALPTLQARLCSAGRDSVIAGVVVVSWALHAALVADSDTEELRRQYGNERFAVAARQNLAEPYVYRGRVTAYKDGTATVYGDEGQVYLLLSRCSHLEPGYCILPAADPLAADVRIHGIRIPAIADGARIGEILMRGYSDAGHVSDESVQVLDADRVEFSVVGVCAACLADASRMSLRRCGDVCVSTAKFT